MWLDANCTSIYILRYILVSIIYSLFLAEPKCIINVKMRIEQILNPCTRYVSEEKCIAVRRHLAYSCELAEGDHSVRARCESTFHRQFALLGNSPKCLIILIDKK